MDEDERDFEPTIETVGTEVSESAEEVREPDSQLEPVPEPEPVPESPEAEQLEGPKHGPTKSEIALKAYCATAGDCGNVSGMVDKAKAAVDRCDIETAAGLVFQLSDTKHGNYINQMLQGNLAIALLEEVAEAMKGCSCSCKTV